MLTLTQSQNPATIHRSVPRGEAALQTTNSKHQFMTSFRRVPESEAWGWTSDLRGPKGVGGGGGGIERDRERKIERDGGRWT